MVTPNLTFFIEVGLFLLFLWGTARFILRPVLKGLDERESGIEVAHEQAEENSARAKVLERDYLRNLSEIRGRAEDAYRKARRETRKGHIEAVASAREWGENAVAEVRAEAMGLVEGQRSAVESAVPDIADRIAERLRSGGAKR